MGTIKLGKVEKEVSTEVAVQEISQEVSEQKVIKEELQEPQILLEENEEHEEEGCPRCRQLMLEEDQGVLFEETERRGLNEKVYRKNDGTLKQVITAHAMHYHAAGEECLCEIDNTFEDRGDFFETKSGRYKVKVAKDTQRDGTVSLSDDDIGIEWNYLDNGAKSAARMRDKKRAAYERALAEVKYEEVAQATDLEYRIEGGNVKENIIVREKQAEYRYRFQLRLKGVTPRLSDDGMRIEFYKEANDEKVAEIPAPFMYDATGDRSDEVYYELEEQDGQYLFTVVADAEWINSESRELPVTIDPQLIAVSDTFVSATTTEWQYYSSNQQWKEIRTIPTGTINIFANGKQTRLSTVTLNISKMNFLAKHIVRAEIFFEINSSNNPSGVYINDKFFGNVWAGDSFYFDLTTRINNGEKLITFKFKPVGNSNSDYENTNISCLLSATRLEIEYLTDDEVEQTQKSFELIGGVGANVDMLTGETIFGFTDVPADEFLLGMGISHVFKFDNKNYRCGSNFRLNLNESFTKVSDASLEANYIYTDACGMKHGMKDYYYYLENGQRNYIEKSSVQGSGDNLTYNGNKVSKEQRCLNGYSLYTGDTEFSVLENAQKKHEDLKDSQNVPDTFLTNGTYIKGFKSGRLVCVLDNNGNSMFISYFVSGAIKNIYDNIDETISFAYNEKGLLDTITDARGRKTKYEYLGGYSLSKVTFANGKTISFVYGNGNVKTVESSYGERASMVYSGNRIKSIERFSTAGRITHLTTTPANTPVSISKVNFTFAKNYTLVEYVNDHKEKYVFASDGNLGEYLVERGGVVVQAEKYSVEYVTKEISTGFIKIPLIFKQRRTESTAPKTLYRASLASFKFQKWDESVSTLNAFNQPATTVYTKQLNSVTKQTTSVEYEYDDEHRILKKTETISSTASGTARTVRVEDYVYNADNGSLESVESYVKGEEDRGKICKYSISGDTLYTTYGAKSDLKFFTQKVYGSGGQLKSQTDENGVKTAYSYVSKTNLLQDKMYTDSSMQSSGGALHYHRNDKDDSIQYLLTTVLSESALCRLGYNLGELTLVGNPNIPEHDTQVAFEYNKNRDLSSVMLNGREDYVSYSYEYGEKSDKVTRILTAADSRSSIHIFEVETDKHGNVLNTTYNYQIQIQNTYQYGKLIKSEDNVSGETESYTYDDQDRVIGYTRGNYNETYRYNGYGAISTVLVNGNKKYEYSYTSDSERRLKYFMGENYFVEYQTDLNGRLTKKLIYYNNKKVASEGTAFLVRSSATTNLPAEVQFSGLLSGTVYDNQSKLQYEYDKRGNIKYEKIDRDVIVSYEYDEGNRLKRVDNKRLNQTIRYFYDIYDNITKKQIYPYTRSNIPTDCIKEINYGYEDGRLKNYNGETFVYDNIGNPTTYRGKAATWTKGRQLHSYNDITFEYDGKGKRTQKGSITFEYDAAGNIISQSNGLEFLLDATGVIGVKYGGNHYFYRKDIQGNIIALLDSNGNVVVQYVYDAWGNHAVLDANGNDITSATHIGNLNPYRYRGYYYDTETGLYYLQSRYYDPELCRFMTIDNIGFIEDEPTCGYNLYAYCGNNPVMNIDPSGHSFTAFLIAGLIALGTFTIAGATYGGINAAVNGGDVWKGIGKGALLGLLFGASAFSIIVGGAFGGAAFGIVKSILMGFGVGSIFVLGLNTYGQLNSGRSIDELNLKQSSFAWSIGGVVGALAGATGYAFGELARFYGEMLGLALSGKTFLGLQIGKVFSANFMYAIGGFLGAGVGGFSGSILLNYVAKDNGYLEKSIPMWIATIFKWILGG